MLEEGADGDAGAPLRQVAGGAALVEGGAGDVEVGPGDLLAVGVLGELLQEEARGQGTAPGAWGGALTAGLFLQEFAKDADGEQIPWAHLDIAGPSFNEGGATGHLPKGGTGVAVGTLLEHIANLD